MSQDCLVWDFSGQRYCDFFLSSFKKILFLKYLLIYLCGCVGLLHRDLSCGLSFCISLFTEPRVGKV